MYKSIPNLISDSQWRWSQTQVHRQIPHSVGKKHSQITKSSAPAYEILHEGKMQKLLNPIYTMRLVVHHSYSDVAQV